VAFVAGFIPYLSQNWQPFSQQKVKNRTLHRQVLSDALAARGSLDEVDFFGVPGGFRRILGAHAKGKPCPKCGLPIQVKNLLGSAAYYCENCQK
jgi:formamidopyrimidine-DNA glycosylase